MKKEIDYAREAAILLNLSEVARRILIASSGEESSSSLEGEAVEDVASNLVYNNIEKRLIVKVV